MISTATLPLNIHSDYKSFLGIMVRSYILGLVLVLLVPLLSFAYGRSQGQARDALQEFEVFSRARRSLTAVREVERSDIPSTHGLTNLKRRKREEVNAEGDSPKKRKKGKKSKSSKKGKSAGKDNKGKSEGKKGKNILNDLMNKHQGGNNAKGGKSTKKG